MKNFINGLGKVAIFLSSISLVFMLVWVSYFEEYLSDGYWGVAWLLLFVGIILWAVTTFMNFLDNRKNNS